MDKVNELLLAAMERHLSWISSEIITWPQGSGSMRRTTRDVFVLNADIPGAPALLVPDSPGAVHLKAEYPASLDMYDGIIKAGVYAIERGPKGLSENVVINQQPAIFKKNQRMAEFITSSGIDYTASSDGQYVLVPSMHLVELVVLSKYPECWYRLTFVDLLALVAAEDARADGRADNAALLADLLPATPFYIDEEAGLISADPYCEEDACQQAVYAEIYAAVDKMLEQQIPSKSHARKTPYRRKAGSNVVANAVTMAIDPITNAVMGRDRHQIEPASYFTETPVKVPTGRGGYALVDVRADANTDIDAAYRNYRLNDRDRFWLDLLYTLAIEQGKTEITGSEILKLAGYANPYTATETMANAAESLQKAMATRIAIDVTEEKRDKRRGHATLTSSIRLQPVVNGIIDLDEYTEDDGNVLRDFTVNLQTKEPAEALPLARYAKARGMLTTVEKGDYTFDSIKRLRTDDRQMWAYILRIVRSRKLRGTILFDTMWRNLELEESDTSEYEDVDKQGNPLEGSTPVSEATAGRRRRESMRKRRERLKSNLEKMLNEKAGKLFKSWSWHKNPSGIIDGVRIVRFSR